MSKRKSKIPSDRGKESNSKHRKSDDKGGLLYQCGKIQLGITHHVGNLEFYARQLIWRCKSNESLKHVLKHDEIKQIEWITIDRRNKMMKISFNDKNRPHFRMIGFVNQVMFDLSLLFTRTLYTLLPSQCRHPCTVIRW